MGFFLFEWILAGAIWITWMAKEENKKSKKMN